MLWTVVNERDGLGDETPSDYLTSVQAGGFYGWPYCYWGKTIDWNRSTLSGYKVIFVPFEKGRPAGPPQDLLWGCLSQDERHAFGRPVGVAIEPDKRSLLVADDVGNVVWRLSGA